MTRPPYDPRRARRTTDEPTWGGILATTAVVLSVPLLLWVATHPLLATLVLAAATGTVVVSRRALRLHRCLAECGGFAIDVGNDLQVCVSTQGSEAAC